MKINEIRKLNDYELKRYINDISNKNSIVCSKCDDIITSQERVVLNIGRNFGSCVPKVKKLCSLCESCYVDLLEFLGISDINWGN